MYEDQTQDVILARLLSKIDDKYEKTPGNLVYDLLVPCAIEIYSLYQIIGALQEKINVDNMTSPELDTYVYQRKGIERKSGGYSSTVLDIQGNGNISIGDLFSTSNNIQFSATENVNINGTGQVHVICTQMGIIGNVPANSITQIPVTITGISSCNNSSTLTDGFDTETDNALRERYYEALKQSATSNNMAHYKEWALQVSGVGDCKVFSRWNGDLTVKVVIVDSNKDMPTDELIKQVQDYIDPMGVQDENGKWSTWGKGYGQSSLGALCTVFAPIAKNINVDVKVSKDANYTDEQIKQNIGTSIKQYLESISLDETNSYVSYAKIGNLVLNSTGVLDYSDLKLNSDTANIPVNLTANDCEIPVLGVVTIQDV